MSFAKTAFTSIANTPGSALAAYVKNPLDQIKAVLNADPNAYNQYVNGMLVIIGRQLFEAPSFNNPFKVVMKGMNEMEHLIQDIHVDPIGSIGAFDGTAGNPLGRKDDNNVKVAYYQTNYKPKYKITVDRVGMMNAMTSWAALDQYWGAKMQGMYTGAAIEEFNAQLYTFNEAIAEASFPKAYIGAFSAKDDASGRALVQAVKVILEDLKFPNTQNMAGVTNVNSPDDFVLVLNKAVKPNIDVYTLASLFNEEYAKFAPRIIVVPSFVNNGGTDNKVLGVLADKKLFKFYKTFETVRPIENPEGLYTNFFYHPWGINQISQFATAVAIVGKDAA